MKQSKSGLFFCLFLCALFAACDQEPLFWDIAHEYPPIEPLIKGASSRIAAIEKKDENQNPYHVLYVSNGDIWEWDISASPSPKWQKMAIQPGGKTKSVAAAGEYLFSLDWDGNIRKFDGSIWSSSLGGTTGKPEQIFGVGDCLFAGSKTGNPGGKNSYCILVMEATDSTMTLIKSDTGLLMGAAGKPGTYYLGTMGDGIFTTTTPASDLGNAVSGTETLSIIGLVEHGIYIVGVTTGRKIVYSSGGTFGDPVDLGNDFSGAIASWEDGTGNRLLLLGIQRSSASFGYGYRELSWKNGANFADNLRPLYTPGAEEEDKPSSVEKGSQYTSAIANHAVHALYVVPSTFAANKADSDERPIVFASTLKEGLWSYRTRGEGENARAQWNGEDNGD